MKGYIFFVFVALLQVSIDCLLIVNVKNRGGDVDREKIESNTTADTVQLEFMAKDGTLVTQFIDYKSDIQMFRVLVPWEEERGIVQSSHQTLCFITRFGKNEFISSDAMSKLRQKNPTAIRSPEEDKGVEKHILDLQVNLQQSSVLSFHMANFCREAADNTYAKEADIRLLSQVFNRDLSVLMSAVKNSQLEKYSRCKDTSEINKPCQCQYQLCIGWYPCGLKYCRGKDAVGKLVNYRCGIKTCKRCLQFEHYVSQKMFCLWDDL